MKKVTALFLCVAMVFSLVACTQETPPAENPGSSLYAQAVDALNSRTDVTLELAMTTMTTVAGDEMSEKTTQTLTYQGKGTAEAMIFMENITEYSVHSEDYAEEEVEPLKYSELWYQGAVYADLNKSYHYQSAMDAEAAAKRYMPLALLDAALYGSITTEEAESGTTIRFTQPTAGEAWAMPQDGELVEASGYAIVNAEKALTEMHYTISYTYGSALIKKTVQSKPLDTPKAVTAPAKPEDYATLTDIDALLAVVSSGAMLVQADTIITSGMSSLVSQAAGLIQNKSVQATLHGRKEDTLAKIKNSVYYMNYTTGEEQKYDLEENFQNGKLTSVANKGLPSTTSISWEDVRSYASGILLDETLVPDYWQDAKITDFGSLYLIEYALNENFGNTTQNSICESLFADASFLVNLSSKYVNAELNGYLSIDKYTGLPVATGYYYKGIHTIEGYDYELTLQYDQSFEAPALGAYQDITEKMPAEEEPENPATPLFYHVTGSEGQEMWLLGTIHIGDARTGYLPEEIREAFENADALAIECDTVAFDKQLEEDEELAESVSALYFSSDGSEIVKDSLSEEDYANAVKLMKAVGGYNANMPYVKPYIWSNIIENFFQRQACSLHADMGVEERLLDWAEELDKEVREIESNMAQLQMMTGFSNDLQVMILEDIMDTDPKEYQADTARLYDLWCAGDEAAMREELSISKDFEGATQEEIDKYTPLVEEYDKAVSFDRNEGMLAAAIEYLESGDVVFYAVGLAHLVDNTNGLIDTLRNAGYTVELVSFA